MKNKNLIPTFILIFLISLTILTPAIAQTENQIITVILRDVDNKDMQLLAEQGIPITGRKDREIIVSVTEAQLNYLKNLEISIEIIKSTTENFLDESIRSVNLSNEYLTISIIDSGQFTMWTTGGRYLLFPSAGTGYLSVKVDNQIYDNDSGSLSIATPFTLVDDYSAFIQYQTPENILITQWFTLAGQAVQFILEATNEDSTEHDVSIRYLLDTQVDVNDGSPLYASTVGVRTYETDFPSPSFNNWRGYDIWPDPTLTSIGTFSTQPDRVVFAWWPNAVGYNWDYTPDPNQQFYTPGYTSSPKSDSCVLTYFNMGSLDSGSKDSITTYYGVGEPTADTDRERLISAFYNFKEAIKYSILADLDAFSSLHAKYIVTLRNDFWDYLEAAWSIYDLAAPDPNDLVKLGPGAEYLSIYADLISCVDTANTLVLDIQELEEGIPHSATENEIKNALYSYLLYEHMFMHNNGEAYIGVSGYLEEIEDDYEFFINLLIDPLPEDYPIDTVISTLEAQTVALYTSSEQECFIPYIDITLDYCPLVKLGVLQEQEKNINELSDAIVTAENISLVTTITEISVAGLGGLKVAGVISTPITIGGSFVVTEAVFWGGIATVDLIASTIGSASDVTSMTIQNSMSKVYFDSDMQLPTDLALRRTIFQETGWWIQVADAFNYQQTRDNTLQNFMQIDEISIPNLEVSANQTIGQGIGHILITNISTNPINVNVYGSLTTHLDQKMPTLGLLGSETVNIPVGEQMPIEFQFTLVRSSLLHHSGYDAHLYITVFSVDGYSILGPYVAHFFVGTDSQLDNLSMQIFETIDRDSLVTGQVNINSFQFSPSSQSGRLLLSSIEGADHDLHIYDSIGNHVGVNYITGEVENQIADVIYSGPTSWPEWMSFSNLGGEIYQVEIVSQSSTAGKGFDLSVLESPLLPAILEAPTGAEWSIVRSNWMLPTIKSFVLQITEGGGSQDITNLNIQVSDFTGSNHNIIPGSDISCDVPDEIVAGTSILVECNVMVDPSLPVDTYQGAFQVNGIDASNTSQTATSLVSINLYEPKWPVYFPLLIHNLMNTGFDSQFNGDAEGWVAHSGSWYYDDNYLWTEGVIGTSSSVSYTEDFDNFAFQVRMLRYGNDYDANRIIIRGTPYPMDSFNHWNSYYYFEYTREGSYSVWKRLPGESEIALQGWATSTAINTGDAWNTLRVVSNGSNLSFYINESLVWSGADISLTSGRVGIGFFRDDDGIEDDELIVDWAKLATSSSTAGTDMISVEQQTLNNEANKNPSSNIDSNLFEP